MSNICELCGRVGVLTKHHLIPQCRHNNKKNKKIFDRKEVKHRTAMLCQSCHSKIHATFSNKILEQQYNTLESLKQHPSIQKFIKWINEQPEGRNLPSKSVK